MDYFKQQENEPKFFNAVSENNKSVDPETKTQNTHDYRKREDLALDDLNFNFSAEKAFNNLTRMDIEHHNIVKSKNSDEVDFCNESDELNYK